jgi:anti-sigma factor RsiW
VSHVPYETLSRYLSGDIDADERASVERHLKDCKFCRRDFEDAREWSDKVASLPGATQSPRWIHYLLPAAIGMAVATYLVWRFI